MPTSHELAAAAQVARFIDAGGNAQADARKSYSVTSTEQGFAPSALRAGEGLLLEAGLLRLVDGRLVPTEALAAYTNIADPLDASKTLERILGHKASEADRAATGAAGEEFVLALVREDLARLHRPDLAARCERVSLISDSFGYDVNAPTLDSTMRRLEVKTQTTDSAPATARFYISRNEYDTGRSNPAEWALVACWRTHAGDVTLLGWCRASTLASYLPADRGGRWTEALVYVPVSVLSPRFPSPV